MLWMKTSGWYDVQKWKLSFGADAQVIEPEHLRDDVRNKVKKMLQSYVELVQPALLMVIATPTVWSLFY